MPGSGPWLPRGSWPTPAGISAHFEPGAASQRRRGRHRAPGLGPDQRQSPQARRYNRRLLRTCYPAALSSLMNSFASRTLDERKRAEHKSHKQALIALARRGINTPGPCSATAPPIRNPPLLSPLRRLVKSIEITGAGHGPSASAGRSEIFSASLNGRRFARAPSRRAPRARPIIRALYRILPHVPAALDADRFVHVPVDGLVAGSAFSHRPGTARARPARSAAATSPRPSIAASTKSRSGHARARAPRAGLGLSGIDPQPAFPRPLVGERGSRPSRDGSTRAGTAVDALEELIVCALRDLVSSSGYSLPRFRLVRRAGFRSRYS